MTKSLVALALAALAGCVSVDKYHEGPVDPQEGLTDLSTNPYAIDYAVGKDHQHILEGTTGDAYRMQGTIPGRAPIDVNPGYGNIILSVQNMNALTNTWTKGSVDGSGILCGFKMKFITRISQNPANDSLNLYWREIEFDSNGCAKSVSAEDYCEWEFEEFRGLRSRRDAKPTTTSSR